MDGSWTKVLPATGLANDNRRGRAMRKASCYHLREPVSPLQAFVFMKSRGTRARRVVKMKSEGKKQPT